MTCRWCGKSLELYKHKAPNYHDDCLRTRMAIAARKAAEKLPKQIRVVA